MPTQQFDSADLDRLLSQVQAYRQAQVGRPHLPRELWMAAATLARSLGVSRVARTLRLAYPKLRQLADGIEVQAPSHGDSGVRTSTTTPGFVEIPLPDRSPMTGSTGSHHGVIEVIGRSQRRLRIETSISPELCTRLLDAFWKGEP